MQYLRWERDLHRRFRRGRGCRVRSCRGRRLLLDAVSGDARLLLGLRLERGLPRAELQSQAICQTRAINHTQRQVALRASYLLPVLRLHREALLLDALHPLRFLVAVDRRRHGRTCSDVGRSDAEAGHGRGRGRLFRRRGGLVSLPSLLGLVVALRLLL